MEGIIEDEDLAANMEAPPLNPKLLTAIQGFVQFIFLTLDLMFRTRIHQLTLPDSDPVAMKLTKINFLLTT